MSNILNINTLWSRNLPDSVCVFVSVCVCCIFTSTLYTHILHARDRFRPGRLLDTYKRSWVIFTSEH